MSNIIENIKEEESAYIKFLRKEYENSLKCKNSLSYWYPMIKDVFKTPETMIVPIDFATYIWLTSDRYKPEDILAFSNRLKEEITKKGFNTNRELFIKTGNFSHKFYFPHCHIADYESENIGEHALNVFYMGACVGCDPSPEFAIREFIHTKENRPSIYDGLKLNTEFRVFYDYDTNEILEIFNYWDKETMLSHLKGTDLENYKQAADILEKEFERKKESLTEYIQHNMNKVKLTGKWSVDFLCDGDTFWLIDMALAEQSFFYEKIKQGGKNNEKITTNG